jgi:glycosyltransferase involved in cell wall biosynthesis
LKVLLALHGFPDELIGGTELSVRALAVNLLGLGHEVVVVAGSMAWEDGFRTSTEVQDTPHGPLTVHRIHRADLYFDHWHKTREPRVAAAFRALLDSEQPDLVHVHHWVRLTDDLVATAARAGIPAVVSLPDLWTSCLITFRVRPDTRRFCDVPLAPDPCLQCASILEPPTPWVERAQAVDLLERRRASVMRELSLARATICNCVYQGDAIGRWVGVGLEPDLIPPGIDYAPTRRAAPDQGRPLTLGCWGHLSQLKGADVLLDALHRLRDPRSIRIVFAGAPVEPEYFELLQARAEGLDVEFHGAYDRAELERHPVTDVHLMVSGSRASESWGIVVDEALLLGLPCVLPAAGAFVERAAGAAWARTYASGDSQDLARVLQSLVDEPELVARMRSAIPVNGEATIDGLEHARRTVIVYERVLCLGAPDATVEDPHEVADAIRAIDAWDGACRGDLRE